MASPDSSCFESTKMVLGQAVQRSPSTLLKRSRLPGTRTVPPLGAGFSHPAIQSNTSLLTLVLLQTTMKTGGVRRWPSPAVAAISSHWA